jgi:hypothetical protein
VYGCGGPGAGDSRPFLQSAEFWAKVCSAGLVGGQECQLRSTRTLSPAVAVVAGELLVLLIVARNYLGGVNVARCTIGPGRQIALNPRRPAVPLCGGDIPRAPGCSLGVTIRWVWGDTQPSRLTCCCKPGAVDHIGTPAKSGGTDVAPSAGSCECSRCADEALPLAPPEALFTVEIRLLLQVHRPYVGRWTGSPGNFSGCVL